MSGKKHKLESLTADDVQAGQFEIAQEATELTAVDDTLTPGEVSTAPSVDNIALLTKRETHKTGSLKQPEAPVESREQWDNKYQYILACVAFAVGLGNVWRFPYLCQKNGGGAFMIPYVIMLVLEGIPLFIIELAIGQRLRKGPLQVWWELNPSLAGIGIASFLVSFFCSVYYNTVVTWCLLYFAQSFNFPLPWSKCPEDTPECQKSSSTSYYWYRETLNIADSLDSPAEFQWKISLALVVAWTVVCFAMIKGIKSSGKVMYVTATLPYLVLTVFCVRGVTLPGSTSGLRTLLTPDLSHMLKAEVWLDAATQIFFSLSLAFGGLIAMSSYMPEENNCYKDAIVVALINCSTSVYAGIVVFAIIGFKAHKNYEDCLSSISNSSHCDLNEFLTQSVGGTGLTFITFTEAIDHFGVFSPVFAVLFFLMLMTLGFGSMFGTCQGVLTSIQDIPMFANVRKEVITAVVCTVSLILAQLFALTTGEYILQIFDEWVATIPLLLIALAEFTAISLFYGVSRFADDIYLMCGVRPNIVMQCCWRAVSPVLMAFIFVSCLISMIYTGDILYKRYDSHLAYAEYEPMPGWAQVLCVVLSVLCTCPIPLVALYDKVYGLQPIIPSFFPEDELRRKRPEYTPSRWEKLLF